MAFYNDIGKKISQTGQGAVQKTKNFAEISKLNFAISELERNITTAYTDMGKLYFQKYAASSEDMDMIPFLQKIAEDMQKIEEYQMQIRVIKGVTQCCKCGGEINADASFCNICGARQMPKVKIVNTGSCCPQCGASVEVGQGFCVQCGHKLETPKPVVEKIFCTCCGAELEQGALFCMNCGQKVGENFDVEKSDRDQIVPSIITDEAVFEREENCTVEEVENDVDVNELPAPAIDAEPEVSYYPKEENCELEKAQEAAFCSECGSKLEPDEIFCSNCGHKVE